MSAPNKTQQFARIVKAWMYVCAGFMYGMAAWSAMDGRDWILIASSGSIILAAAISINADTT